MKKCETCLKKRRHWWELKNCSTCRRQWRAYRNGDTNISPMERAITAEQVKRVKKLNKKAKQLS